jgi:hypothetical protein
LPNNFSQARLSIRFRNLWKGRWWLGSLRSNYELQRYNAQIFSIAAGRKGEVFARGGETQAKNNTTNRNPWPKDLGRFYADLNARAARQRQSKQGPRLLVCHRPN